MKINSQKDFYSGLLLTAVGTAFAYGSTTYKIGRGALMGPGYFPLILSVVLLLLGIVILAGALIHTTEDGEKMGPWAWKPLLFIIGSNLVFGVLLGGVPSFNIPSMGLIVAIYALTFIAAMAGEEFNFKEVAIVATVLAVMSYVAFVLLLKLQFPIWPALFSA